MLRNEGHILTDDIVVDYKNTDRDVLNYTWKEPCIDYMNSIYTVLEMELINDSLHFLTHLDTTCKDIAMNISPNAKIIITSVFNAYSLRSKFNVRDIDVRGLHTNKSYKFRFNGNEYSCSFLDSKFTTGSVSLLLHGPFGTYLYTGNFCYHPSFVRSPLLLPLIEEKALTRLYLDNTYYENPSNFFGIDELATEVATLIKSEPKKNFYMYAEKLGMDPLLGEIASKLEEKVYVSQSTMWIMKSIGYGSYFTRNSCESRIFNYQPCVNEREYGHDNIIVYLNCLPETCKSFKKIEKKGNIYDFYFYCHSNHKEICELLTKLRPKSVAFLFSEIDKSKISHDFNFINDAPRTVFKYLSDKSSTNTLKAEDKSHTQFKIIPILQFSKSCIEAVDNCRVLVKNGEVNYNNNHENQNLSANLLNENKFPLRIRKVSEINDAGLFPKSLVEGNDTLIQNVTSSVRNDSETDAVIKNMETHSTTENLHNCSKYKKLNNTSVEMNCANSPQLASNSSSEKKLIHIDGKPCTIQAQTGLPLIMNRKLVRDNSSTLNRSLIKISKGGASREKKNTIVLLRKHPDIKKVSVNIAANSITNKSKLNYLEHSNNTFIKKRQSTLIEKSKNLDPLTCNNIDCNAICRPHRNLSNLLESNLETAPPVTEPDKTSSMVPESISYNDSISTSVDNTRNFVSLQSIVSNGKNEMESDSVLYHLESVNEGNQMREASSEIGPNDLNMKSPFSVDKSINYNGNYYDGCPSQLESGKEAANENFGNENDKGQDVEIEKDSKNCDKKYTEDTHGENYSKHTLSVSRSDDENVSSRKKLRSDSFRLCLLKPNMKKDTKKVTSKECRVSLRRDNIEGYYFFSKHRNCHLPKFWGFKKHEIRPRHVLLHLRSLQKVLEKLYSLK